MSNEGITAVREEKVWKLDWGLSEGLSLRAGQILDRAIRLLAKTHADAFCGVYCFQVACNTSLCPPGYPNEYDCHDYCSGTHQDLCFSGSCVSGFCWSQQC
jgi:hypothetical protein